MRSGGGYALKERQAVALGHHITSAREIISQTQEMMATLYGTLSIHSDYLLAGNQDILTEYDYNKQRLTETLALLTVLTDPYPAQASRLVELQHHYLALIEQLDSMVRENKIDSHIPAAEAVNPVSEIRKSFDRLAKSILIDEQSRLEEGWKKYRHAKKTLYINFGTGLFLTALILIGLSSFLLLVQGERNAAGGPLKEAEERWRLAIRGTNDGVYDWNLITQELFWSPQFKALLGYQDEEVNASRTFLETLMHPDDRELATAMTNKYLNRELAELSCIFRVKHKNGHWIWVQKRGKALFDEDGRAVRLIGTYSDISALKEYEVRLVEAKDLAEKANAAKTEFLAHMSHEIRTPLTSISGVAEILMNQKNDFNAKQQQLVKVLGYSTTNLKELINDILDFSKIESGQMELEEKPFALSELFQEIISTMAVRAQEKGLQFVFDYTDVAGRIFLGDKIRLRQILMNLIGNALKFTHEGSVNVEVKNIDFNGTSALQVVVKDTGIGIDPKNYDLVFERFRQADASVSRKYGGSGLGLAISQNLVERMGGKITLNSELEKGSIFTVILPMSAAEIGATYTLPILKSSRINQLKAGHGDASRILLVEDYVGNIVVLSYILESLGCDFQVARTGLQAINLWKEMSPDLILMDVQMPEMDGLTATRQIRKIEEGQGLPRTPIIGMTAHAFVEDKDKCTQAGMDSYLAKPIAENDLIGEISRYLQEKEARLERQASSQ